MADKPAQRVEDVPDPDEDDLDDLDEVLDEFQASSISQPKPVTTSTTSPAPAPSASGPGRPATETSKDGLSETTEDDFAKQLQAGMSSLISELDQNPEMQSEFEKMMQELLAAGSAPSDQEAGEHLKQAAEAAPKAPEDSKPAAGKSASNAKKSGDDFQDTIRRTMARMQASSDQASASTTNASAQSEEDLLAQMMRELTDGEGGEGDFNSMLMNMMSQLTHKEILYDPMKELSEKFPAWLEKNRGQCAKDDLARYEEQQKLVGEIVGRFERKGYSDANEDDREYIVERMQKMQEQGSPPSDLVGDMNAAQEALGDLDAGCPTQ